MRKYIIGGLIALIGSISFSFAYQDDCGNSAIDVQQVFSKGISQSVNNTNGIFELQDNANFLFDDTSKVFHYGDNSNGAWLFWNEFTLEGENYSQLYLLVVRRGNIDTQGYVQYYTYVPIGKVCIGNSKHISNFYEGNTFSSPDTLSYYANLNYRPEIAICLGYSDLDTNVCFNYNNLTGTLNIGMGDLENLSQLYGNSKWTNNTKPTQPTNNYQCTTIQQLINTYPEQYNTGLCYSNNITFSGGTIQTVTPKTIFEVYPTFAEFRNGINNYNNYCKAPATTETCQQAFEGNEEGRQIINKLPNDVQALKVYEYCNLTLNLDPNGTTCTYTTGTVQGSGVTVNDIISEIGKGLYEITIPESTESGNVYERLLPDQEDETARRDIISNAQNIVGTMKSLYAKITGIFNSRTGTNGIIPRYITSLILIIVLYKLFRK